jgi:hypothetical protein
MIYSVIKQPSPALADCIAAVLARVPLALRSVPIVLRTLPSGTLGWVNEFPDGEIRVELSPLIETLPTDATAYVIAHELAHVAGDHVHLLRQVKCLPSEAHEDGELCIEAMADLLVLEWGFTRELRAFEAHYGETPPAGSAEWRRTAEYASKRVEAVALRARR